MDLLDFIPAAATADPVTSHEAASLVTASGARAKQARDVAAAVAMFPGCTSLELAGKSGLDRHLIARRLPDCEKLGLVRRGAARVCTASSRGLKATTWWPVGGA